MAERSRRSWLALRNLVKACWSPLTIECNEELECLVGRVPDDVLVECLVRIPRSSLPDCMMVSRKWRHILMSDDYYHLRRKLGRVDSVVLVFGEDGARLWSATYCEGSRVWQRGYLGALQENDCLDLSDAQPAVVKHRIFILGASSQNCTIVYDMWSKSLTRAAPMLCRRSKFACCVISNRIFVAGGGSGDAEVYIPELKLWRRIASMPRDRYRCHGAAVDGIFYVVGGTEFDSESMDSFDTRSNSWQETKPLPMSGRVLACTVVGHCMYVLSNDDVELSLWKYDTQSESWTKIEAPPILRKCSSFRFLFSCVTMGSSVYVIQLRACIEHVSYINGESPVLAYDTQLQEWSRGPDLPYVDMGAACTVVESSPPRACASFRRPWTKHSSVGFLKSILSTFTSPSTSL